VFAAGLNLATLPAAAGVEFRHHGSAQIAQIVGNDALCIAAHALSLAIVLIRRGRAAIDGDTEG